MKEGPLPSQILGPAGRRLEPEELRRRRPLGSELEELPRRPLVAVLENIRSLWNVGSVFRTADAVRLEQLHLCGYTGHPPRPEIAKTALGATETVPWSYWSRSADALEYLREHGYQILALELTTHSRPLAEIELRAPLALVVGNEVSGVSDEALALCDAAMEIPMDGAKESLNVSVAFGVAAFALAVRVPL
jgi:tRNA G18 (ribose-2'-O)-methylase SpoU